MKKMALKDIARLAGVSTSTVSFVLNGKGKQMRISTAVEKKIKSLATKHGYQPNQVAISLRTGRSNLLGLIVETISGNFLASLARVIEKEAEAYGYKIVYCSTENQLHKGQELIRMLSQRQVDGYIITPTPGMESDITKMVNAKKPVVLMDSFYKNSKVPYVLVDNYRAISDGMQFLLKKSYLKIAFISVEIDLSQLKEREKAYLDIMKKEGLPGKELLFRLPYDTTKEDSIDKLSSFIKKNPELEILFFATNYLGLIGLETIRVLNLEVPGDIGILCFDDHDLFRLYTPGISVIAQPVEEIAKTAVQLLMAQLGKKGDQIKNFQVTYAAKIIARESTN